MVKPFLKWVGGKTKLLPTIHSFLPEKVKTYYEPFIGGGAVFFSLQRSQYEIAHLSDLNERLINTYVYVRDHLDALEKELRDTQVEFWLNRKEFFEGVKKNGFSSEDSLKRAAAFIFLNKTCFNGLYRVNRKDEFNSPYGKYDNPNILNGPVLRACQEALGGTTLICQDFEDATAGAVAGDFVYLDPPYVPVSNTANFRNYGPKGFKHRDQLRLAEMFDNLAAKGVSVMLSNADVPTVRELYGKHEIVSVEMPRAINSNGSKRGKVGEVLVIANLQRQTALQGQAQPHQGREDADVGQSVSLDDIGYIEEQSF